MSFEEFLAAATPPSDAALRALWLDARGDWEKAHLSVQNDSGRAAAWVHAYLHRKEGDAANAGYWYARAGRRPPATALGLDAEREAIARELLGKSGA
jgi:hypothetical protein